MRTLVLSDAHIGDPRFDGQKVIDILERETFDRLILNGDFVDLWAADKKEILNNKLFRYVCDLAQSKLIVWATGNHDHDIAELYVGKYFYICKSYRVEEAGKTVLVLHGNQVYTWENKSWINKLGYKINLYLYKWFGWDLQSFFNKTKCYGKYVRGKREDVLEKYHKMADTIVIGHTHRVGCASKGSTMLYDIGSVISTYSYAVIENGIVYLRICR